MLNQAAEGEVIHFEPPIRHTDSGTRPPFDIHHAFAGARAKILPHYGSVEAIVTALAPSDPVFCINASEIKSATRRFASSFPGRVLYAVKCNPHPFVLETLYRAGVTDFDAASLDEIKLIDSLFGKAAGTYFNNPAKSRPAIRSASHDFGVRFYTVDHRGEVEKILDEAERNEDLVIAVRVATNSKNARYALSTKFGAPPDEAADLLSKVHRAGVRVGLSFHVGSQCLASDAFSSALKTCRDIVRRAGTPIHVLNVGGGFPAPYPGDEAAMLEQYFAAIIFGQHSLGLPPGCVLLCEPGRSLVATAGSVIAQVLVRKDRCIYINDGIFGNLQELRHPKEHRPARIIRQAAVSKQLQDFRVYGPTCDSDDVLAAPLNLPSDVAEGDWIEIGMMGAYSIALRTEFNGFFPRTVVSVGD